ncbi:hypothetical protein BJ970_001638 [Saccharopolyspora phatthalungensis]|uniref:Uncharacterized protein n=1 Tax=Saccharopolyspora phatthalungensis TaxID=664693 RepID=A0A840Q159_9PSEU|nr:hypothetical protein [Saccharopolyspora phatthalungensis]
MGTWVGARCRGGRRGSPEQDQGEHGDGGRHRAQRRPAPLGRDGSAGQPAEAHAQVQRRRVEGDQHARPVRGQRDQPVLDGRHDAPAAESPEDQHRRRGRHRTSGDGQENQPCGEHEQRTDDADRGAETVRDPPDHGVAHRARDAVDEQQDAEGARARAGQRRQHRRGVRVGREVRQRAEHRHRQDPQHNPIAQHRHAFPDPHRGRRRDRRQGQQSDGGEHTERRDRPEQPLVANGILQHNTQRHADHRRQSQPAKHHRHRAPAAIQRHQIGGDHHGGRGEQAGAQRTEHPCRGQDGEVRGHRGGDVADDEQGQRQPQQSPAFPTSDHSGQDWGADRVGQGVHRDQLARGRNGHVDVPGDGRQHAGDQVGAGVDDEGADSEHQEPQGHWLPSRSRVGQGSTNRARAELKRREALDEPFSATTSGRDEAHAGQRRCRMFD